MWSISSTIKKLSNYIIREAFILSKQHIYLVGILLYICMLIIIGLTARKRVKTAADFQLGGGKIPMFVLVGTLIASWLGSGTVVGYASRVYYFGVGGVWYALACLFSVAYFTIIIGRIRSVPARTTPEMLELRYGKTARKWAVLPVFLGQATIGAYQIKAVGYIFEVCFGINSDLATVIGTAIIIGYTFLGGFFAVAWSDVCQSLIFMVGMLLAIPFAVHNAGGWSGMIQTLGSIADKNYLSMFNVPFMTVVGIFVPTALLGGTSMFMYQRAWAAKSVEDARKGAMINFCGAAFIYTLVLIFGLTAIITCPGIKGDTVVFSVANQLPIIIGLLLIISCGAVFISTGDSLLLAAAAVFVREIYMANKEPDDKKELLATRITVAVIGVAGLLLLRFYPQLISLMMLAYTVEGAGLLCPLVAGMYWKGGTEKGAVASIVVGLAITIGWEVLKRGMGIPFFKAYPSVLVSVPLAAIAYFVISNMTRGEKEIAIAEKFFHYYDKLLKKA